jgi:hypothetical protein
MDSPWKPGTPEDEEWRRIAAAPSAHTPAPLIAPDDPEHLAALEQVREEIRGPLAVPAGFAQLSASTVLFGPDVSQYQGKPDWPKVRASHTSCRIGGYKVSEGRTFVDPSHAHNRAQAPAAGLVPLAYHYLYFSDEYAANPALWAAQADWFVKNADPAAIHVLDVEAPATAGHHLGVREWVARYRMRLPSHPLGVYTNRVMWQNRSRMPYDPAGLFDFVWHAGVGNGYYTTAQGSIPAQWQAQGGLVNSLAGIGYPLCRLWQITDHARVPGIGGSFCDGNGFVGTLADLRALATGDDTMSKADVDALKAYIDGLIPKIRDQVADEVLGRGIQTWDGVRSLPNIASTAMAYARDGRDAAKLAVGQTDTLEASEAAEAQQLGALTPDALAEAIAAKLGGNADAAQIKAAVAEALIEQLPGVHLAVDAPAS